MRVIETTQKMVSVEQVTEVVCNKCGKSIELLYSESVQHITLGFGYGSKHDGQQWGMDLCECCIDKLVEDFAIEPEKTGGDIDSWDWPIEEESISEEEGNTYED